MLNRKQPLIASILMVIGQTQQIAQRVSQARIQPLEASEWIDAHREILGARAREGRRWAVSMYVNSAGVQLEPGFTGLPR